MPIKNQYNHNMATKKKAAPKGVRKKSLTIKFDWDKDGYLNAGVDGSNVSEHEIVESLGVLSIRIMQDAIDTHSKKPTSKRKKK